MRITMIALIMCLMLMTVLAGCAKTTIIDSDIGSQEQQVPDQQEKQPDVQDDQIVDDIEGDFIFEDDSVEIGEMI